MAGLLDEVLPWAFSTGNTIKRNVKGLLGNPAGFIESLGQDMQSQHGQNMQDYATLYGGGLMTPEAEKQAALQRQAEMAMGLLGVGQAKRGGQIGLNSEFYKGGQFLPSSERTVKGAMQFPKGQRAGGKAEVEPGVWVARPVDGAKPIKNVAEYDWQAFRQTGQLQPFSPFYKNAPQTLPEAAAHSEAFNKGARWLAPDGSYLDASGKPM